MGGKAGAIGRWGGNAITLASATDSRPSTGLCSCLLLLFFWPDLSPALWLPAPLPQVRSILEEQGMVEVTCEFCRDTYQFQQEEVLEALAAADAVPIAAAAAPAQQK